MKIEIETLGLAKKIRKIIEKNHCMIEVYQARQIVKMLKEESKTNE